MENRSEWKRPSFDEAQSAWEAALQQRGLPTQCLWIFDENLCFESNPGEPSDFKLGFQIQFASPPPEAERVAYEYFADFEEPLVFYCLGSSGGKSVCLMLCDKWFESKSEQEGYLRQAEWGVYFRPGEAKEVEEITQVERWKNRIIRNRPLHDLDFCMTLRAVHEILAHGYALSSYEHFALKFLHLWSKTPRRAE